MRTGILVLAASLIYAASPQYDRAFELYQRTEYQQALTILEKLPNKDKDTAALQLMGQAYFGLSEYKKATDVFEKAIVLAPGKSELYHWLGRTYGRRAETGSMLTALGYASKTRQFFEKAVELDPNNGEAVNDLFDFYLEAPGFLGGGMQKAEDVAKRIAKLDAAEGHYAQAKIHDKRKEFGAAENNFRRAAELSPLEVGRVLDIAKYLAKLGRTSESDAVFEKAVKMAPDSPKVLFDRAQTYIQAQRNLAEARGLLERYLKAPLTPEDPSRDTVESMLRKLPKP